MVRALKKRDKNGQRYVRPPAIEQSIATALTQPTTTWIERAGIGHRNNDQYLAPEVIVHLIRHSLRMQDDRTASRLIEAFGKRVMRLLERRVKESRAFSAATVREETVGRFFELFADDLKEPEEVVLDFYEIGFNRALVTLRAQVIRHERLRTGESLSAPEPQNAEDDPEPIELPDLSPNADPLECARNAELYRFVQALPPDERDAILRKYYRDLDTESTDSTKTTVASLAEVSGSEIRSRLRSAYARLKKRMEEKS
jgi:DNA-directed RNA polymerase specialized sigma24 family protein